MFLRNVMVGAHDATLQERVKTLDRLRVRGAADVLSGRVIDGPVTAEVVGEVVVNRGAVGHHRGFGGGPPLNYADDILGGYVRNLPGVGSAMSFDESDDWSLLRRRLALMGVLRLAADVGFVNLNRSTKLPEGAMDHRVPNALRHKPGRLVRDAEHAVELMA